MALHRPAIAIGEAVIVIKMKKNRLQVVVSFF